MLRTRRLPATTYTALKTATQQFIDDAFGTQTLAAKATRVGQSAISDYGNRGPEQAETFMPIDVMLDLVSASGNVDLLRHLATQAGCLLHQLHDAGSDAVGRQTMRSSQEYAELIASVMAAKADGKITPAESTRVLADISELMRELHGLAAAVQAAVVHEEAAS